MPPLTACLFCALLLRTAADPTPPSAPALTLWQRGQSLLVQGDSEKAIPCFQQSLKLDPDLARNHLSLAAAYADQGEDNLCLLHLGRYVQMEPTHLAARLQYADLLVRLDHPAAARASTNASSPMPRNATIWRKNISCIAIPLSRSCTRRPGITITSI